MNNHIILSINLNNYNTKINPLYCKTYEEEEFEKICRICLENDGELISVCGCKGSVKYVHKDCIKKWQQMAPTLESKIYCQLCKEKYQYDGQIEEKVINSISCGIMFLIVLFASLIVILILIIN
jgi:E3 ubiquitin-protein ligase DOA10